MPDCAALTASVDHRPYSIVYSSLLRSEDINVRGIMYALVEIAGKQYKAEEGSLLKVDKLQAAEGETVKLDSVLLVNKDGAVSVGSPFVGGAVVTATVEGAGRDKKVVVSKYKKRKRYKRKHGHRQHYSLLRVRDVAAN